MRFIFEADDDLNDQDNQIDVEDDEPIPTEPNENDQAVERDVEDARLLRKRMHADGTYEELWIYHVGGEGDYARDERIRAQILQDTDIDLSSGKSNDDQQTMKIWRSGDVEFLEIVGLPN